MSRLAERGDGLAHGARHAGGIAHVEAMALRGPPSVISLASDCGASLRRAAIATTRAVVREHRARSDGRGRSMRR